MPHQPTTVSEARLRSVLNTAADGIIVIDERATIMVYNIACETLFGYPASEVVGRNIQMLMPPEFADHHDRYIGNYLETGERRIIGIGREVKGRHQDGTIFPLELSVGEAFTPAGRQFIGILRDLRQRKTVEQRLNQLQGQLINMARIQAVDEMGAAVAHELNQPLTAVILYLQAVTRKITNQPDQPLLPDGPIVDILHKAVREAERAGSIIQRMRQLVERREPQRQMCDLNALIDEALELTMLGHDIAGLNVIRDLDPALSSVDVDPVQIEQVFVNLIRNAMEAVRPRDMRQIRVKSSAVSGSVTVEIEDSGPGIPPEAAANLFKAFASSKRSGLGLGLMISRSIAQNHGGDLTVDGGGDGRGATFTLRLPIVGADPDGAASR